MQGADPVARGAATLRRPGRLERIVVATADAASALEVYRTLCGTEPTERRSADGSARSLCFALSSATIELTEPVGTPTGGIGATLARHLASRGQGCYRLGIAVEDLEAPARELEASGGRVLHQEGRLFVHPASANGVTVVLAARPAGSGTAPPSRVRLDHVAIRVHDLAASAARWESLTGAPAQPLGIHPVSDGAFEATRFEMGDQMVELVAPVAGRTSAIAERLRSHGEGVHAVAMPAPDLDDTLERLRAAGARAVRREPHWFVHPADTAGLLVQLTPRVRH